MKKYLILLLVAIISLSLLLGCDNSSKTPSPQGQDDYYVTAYYFPNWGGQDPNKLFDYNTDCEWGRVKNAVARFEGHNVNQPLWGYENHADPKVMEKVIDCAVSYGVDAFSFDTYWFRERRLAKTGTNGSNDGNGFYLGAELLNGFLKAENCQDMDFSIFWCNHDGDFGEKAIFEDEEEWDIMTDYYITNFMSLPNYSRVDGGKLYFNLYNLVNFVEIFKNQYGMTDIVKAKAALERFRQKVRDQGLGELYITTMITSGVDGFTAWEGGIPPANWDPVSYLGIDAVQYFLPTVDLLETYDYSLMEQGGVIDYGKWAPLAVEESKKSVEKHMSRSKSYNLIPNIPCGYDATIRIPATIDWDPQGSYPQGPMYHNVTPENFKIYAQGMKEIADTYGRNEIYLNSWNEWGEGSKLEPDTKYGYGLLRVVKELFGPKQK